MNHVLLKQGRETIQNGIGWLNRHENDILNIKDLSAHYKAPYLYAALGDPIKARRYADLMEKRYLQKDGDFRTEGSNKGWSHLRVSPENRYIYSNGWIITGLRRLGTYGLADRGIEFVRSFQSSELGGFFSRFDEKTHRINNSYLDSSSTSSAGLALLATGFIEQAVAAGDFILQMIAAQPDPDRYFYSSWQAEQGLMTDIWGNEDQNSLRGRKQFCLSTEADPCQELTWLIGKPMKFLAKLYDQTREKKYLDGAIFLFDFFHKLAEGRWKNYASCKVMWAGAEIYRHTGERRFAETAERILEWFCKSQDTSGIWVHTLWYRGSEDQPLAATLDIIQELCAEICDTLFDLCRGEGEGLIPFGSLPDCDYRMKGLENENN
jgi:hypothetical protein